MKLEKKGLSDNNNLPLFFIVGMSRSGTTMLRCILDSHKNVVLTNREVDFYLQLYKKYYNINHYSEKRLSNLFDDLTKCNLYRKQFINQKELEKLIDDRKDNISFAEICKIIFQSFKSNYPKDEIKLLGDKCPKNSLFIKYIYKIFPDAKFIYLIRSPKDCIASNKINFNIKSVVSIAYYWKYYNELLFKFSSKHPKQFYVVKYEELVSKPKEHVKNICEFLNIGYHDNLLDFYINTYKFIENRKHPPETLHKNLMKPVNTNEIGKWKNKLTEFESKICETIVYKTAKKFNYEANNYPNLYLFVFGKIFLAWLTIKTKYSLFRYLGIVHKTKIKWNNYK